MPNTREVQRSFQEISSILYPTGLNPKSPPHSIACQLLEELDKVESLGFQTCTYDATPQGDWVRSFRDLAYMGRRPGKPKHHRY